MPYTLHTEPGGIICRFTGDFSDEMLQANSEILKHPDFTTFSYQIIDLTNVSTFSISTSAIVAIAQMDMQHYDSNPTHKVAVISTAAMMKGLNNMYLAYAQVAKSGNTWPSQMFTSIQDALEWIKA